MTHIKAHTGERLDTLCYRHYGHLNGSVEAVLAANNGLARQASTALPAGLELNMPITPPTHKKPVVLW